MVTHPYMPHNDVSLFAAFLVADVPFRFTALTRSCVVIPCSFQHEADVILKRGIWSKKTGGAIYHNAQSFVLDHFKGRTKLVGNLDEGDCSLEIDDIKPFDNGPFCFHAEGEHQTYRFNNSCVFIIMKGLKAHLFTLLNFNWLICFPVCFLTYYSAAFCVLYCQLPQQLQ